MSKRVLSYIKSCMRHFYVQKLNMSMYLNMKPSKKQILPAMMKVIPGILRQEVNRENFENIILKGKIELLPTSSYGDMAWFMDTYIEMVNMLLT